MNSPRDLPARARIAPVLDDQIHIGERLSRPGLGRLVQGRGRYVDDLQLPRLVHVVFWRCPVAHARILAIDPGEAKRMPGVVAIFDGAEIARVCKPFVGVLSHLAGIKSAPQFAMAIDRACWQGEPVVAVVAQTRAQAEDALGVLQVDWEELPAVLDPERRSIRQHR